MFSFIGECISIMFKGALGGLFIAVSIGVIAFGVGCVLYLIDVYKK